VAKKKTKNQPKKKQVNAENVIGLHSEVTDQPITQTLEVNYMPYAMSVNVSRAFPEIDGFKPSHRKLLYTMYKMGLLKGERQKSANIVGQTMKLNPHGDAAIYETMVRLATGNEALLAPFVESKGNFGKYYSGDLSYAASRYTEAKLSPISAEIFKDIDKDPVDFVDSYDGAMKEPRLLPTTFPNILVSANKGIGVAMASDISCYNNRITGFRKLAADFNSIFNLSHSCCCDKYSVHLPFSGYLCVTGHDVNTCFFGGFFHC
jgi:DNA gyrase subunit A